VVSREAPELYEELRERFADDPKVIVILDRRVAERRRRVEPVPVERRQRDRRTRPEVQEELRTSQYAIVTLP
jgi:hypothetical protein